MIDWPRGEWYEEVKDGRPQGAKAEPWKGCVRACVVGGWIDGCVLMNGLVTDHLRNTSINSNRPYHNGRAMVLCLEELRRGL